MTYSMYDKLGRGDAGSMSKCLMPDGSVSGERPKVGGRMMVGSPYARTYSVQDYWCCTEIKEIISESKDEVVFRTRTGSIYTWSEF